ncbi:LytTR family transcriptional regulator DNA-binding domain-containing protein, partial [Eshraghiella crossota]|uniref:LytTR family transcriptional regulator DNA-binding domain-containing protein n=1 Tax=Eshraghiella crossota TaxID=45851 RepID=UPI003FD849A3
FVTPECNEYDFEEQILIDSKLSELYGKYEKYGFEFASVSYIVNMRYVKQIVASELVLYTDERLSISKKYYKEFREKFARNLAKKY